MGRLRAWERRRTAAALGGFCLGMGTALLLPRDLAPPPAADDSRELVVLVHGMGRSRLSMLALEHRLERAGYRVLNFGYSSTSRPVAEIGARLASRVEEQTGAASRVHFVGHSLGSIVVRWALANDPPARGGRVVMLAPPNQGARTADRYAAALGWLLPPIAELRTTPGSTARSLPALAGREVGIISGEFDGKVRPEETRLAGARAYASVPATHSFLMFRQDVHRLVLAFLHEGRFPAEAAAQPAA